MNEFKKPYLSPSLEKVEIDNEITLILASDSGNPWDDPETSIYKDTANDSHLA
ncbi:MAG: hypothetical protein NTY32_11335 [Bacteroidia bacterium]|nr:hypothetical protein [Bacteroidia bacterium]